LSTTSLPTTAAFSNLVPLHTRHGRFLTMSSGARSRWAALEARTRCTKSVISVNSDGSNKIITKVKIGLDARIS
jgi:hypothetical protein